jgi:hypothetical protein
MKFLKMAQEYAEMRGDDNWFAHIYTMLREYNSVEESVWKTLSYLYSTDVANALQKGA